MPPRINLSKRQPLGWSGGTEVGTSLALLWLLALQPLAEEAKESRGQEQLLQQGSLVAPVGEFLWYPRGELNTPLCLNIKEVSEQCIGQSPITICGSTWDLQRCITNRFLIYTSPNPRVFAWGTSACESTPHPALLLRVCP